MRAWPAITPPPAVAKIPGLPSYQTLKQSRPVFVCHQALALSRAQQVSLAQRWLNGQGLKVVAHANFIAFKIIGILNAKDVFRA